MSNILDVRDLKVYFYDEEGNELKIVDGVNLTIKAGATHGLMGESGSGKSVLAQAIMRLIPPMPSFNFPAKEVSKELQKDEVGLYFFDKTMKQLEKKSLTSFFTHRTFKRTYHHEWEVKGQVFFKDIDLLKLSEFELNEIRGKEMTAIWQNPIPSLNPVKTIGWQTAEPLKIHEDINNHKVRELVLDYLGKVEIPDPKRKQSRLPKEFSQGEGQRIMISMALITNPSLLIADEPMASLDTTVQRRVMELLKELRNEFNLSMLLITHDLSVIAEMSDWVSVMYAGRIVETGPVRDVYKNPLHPYTRGLMASIPRIDIDVELKPILGEPPDPRYPLSGCPFHPRCYEMLPICQDKIPSLKVAFDKESSHQVACWLR